MTLGSVTKNIRQFRRLCRSLNLQETRIITKCMEVALSTFFVKEIRLIGLVLLT